MKKILSFILILLITGCSYFEEDNKFPGLDIVNEGFVLNREAENKYIEVYLDKGTYGVTTYDNYYASFEMEIFDKDKEKLDCFPQFDFHQGGYVDFLFFTFHIEERGTYYMKFFNGLMDSKTLYFNKLDYKSYFWQEKEASSKIEGTIEGKHDIDYYYYENEGENKIATLTNNSDKSVFIIMHKEDVGLFLNEILPNKSIELELKEGKTGFGITHSIALFLHHDSEYKYSYNITFEI